MSINYSANTRTSHEVVIFDLFGYYYTVSVYKCYDLKENSVIINES